MSMCPTIWGYPGLADALTRRWRIHLSANVWAGRTFFHIVAIIFLSHSSRQTPPLDDSTVATETRTSWIKELDWRQPSERKYRSN
jgi:hypothetical protein